MRILFCSPLKLLNTKGNVYNGGGWISSLIGMICMNSDYKIGVLSIDDKHSIDTIINDIHYYTIIRKPRKIVEQLKLFLGADSVRAERSSWTYYKHEFIRIITDFKPDVIYVFGSETELGLISLVTKIPIILHIQGILNPYLNAYMPPGFSWHDNRCGLLSFYKNRMGRIDWNRRCYRERIIIENINNYFGRTTWDKRLVRLMNPTCHYYECWEILRNEFYISGCRTIPERPVIVSVISSPHYKGFDVILKTAKLLKEFVFKDFVWSVYGNVQPASAEQHTGILHDKVNVCLRGVATAGNMVKELLNSSVYVHPSYIDNSPNSLCEAQILGCAVVATNVGGVSSLIEEGKTGFLVPANDPYQLAFLIKELCTDFNLNQTIGSEAKRVATKRHNGQKISNSIIEALNNIITI